MNETFTRLVFDCELIGTHDPVFLVRTKNVDTGARQSFWWHKKGHMAKLDKLLKTDALWISFNGIGFDVPLISAALAGRTPIELKLLAAHIIERRMRPWQVAQIGGFQLIEIDHIDLIEVAPGVKVSLKSYMGRMYHPTLVDMPFDHTTDLTRPKDLKILEHYCGNDCDGTERLYLSLTNELALRCEMSEEYGIDLRSKSDAQVAEAVLKIRLGITKSSKATPPLSVRYTAPSLIKTTNPGLRALITRLEAQHFEINPDTGSPLLPEWLEASPVRIKNGVYKFGIGGLHSQHDLRLHVEEGEHMISDFDVISYYPTIILNCQLTPQLAGGKGAEFLSEYREIYERRLEAKRAGNKTVANSLKITLNGTFGKLGSIYSAFYSPDLMLAVTLTGQLNLLCLISDIESVRGAEVISANTDGIMVRYTPEARERVLKVLAKNARHTGFEYEETRYRRVAMKDVNNYIAITADDKIKAKGLYAPVGLQKNPTMEACSDAAIAWLKTGRPIHESLRANTEWGAFTAMRTVNGGGVQHKRVDLVDDWVLVKDLGTKDNEWARQAWIDEGSDKVLRRKSRPHPVEVGTGGTPFGRVARWYMTTESMPAITYVGSGKQVPKTEGARLCLTLPEQMPPDLDFDWYIRETVSMLADMGVEL